MIDYQRIQLKANPSTHLYRFSVIEFSGPGRIADTTIVADDINEAVTQAIYRLRQYACTGARLRLEGVTGMIEGVYSTTLYSDKIWEVVVWP